MILENCVILMLTHLLIISQRVTAKTNDEGFDTIFDSYLNLSNFTKKDILMIFSVGGGHKKNVSVNLIKAIQYAKSRKGKIYLCSW